MILLDTDVLTLVQLGAVDNFPRLRAHLVAGAAEPLRVSIVSFEEQMRGWLAQIARTGPVERHVRAYTRLRNLFEDYRGRLMLDFDDRAAAEFRRLTALKLRLGTMDLRIAAIALANGATLITRNLADFRKVPGLVAEDWTAPRAV